MIPTVMPRWGKVGKQKIVDEGPLAPFPEHEGHAELAGRAAKAKYDMETFDDVLVKASSDFMDKAKKDGKPFFVWHNTTRMHVFTYLAAQVPGDDELDKTTTMSKKPAWRRWMTASARC